MNALTYYYFSLGSLIIIFAPLIIMIAAIAATLHMSKRRWVVHLLTFAAMLVALPIYFRIGGILDPTTIDYPGPGEGFLVLLYGFFLVPAVLLYAAYAWVTRKRRRPPPPPEVNVCPS
jgi:hypothetical protein